METNDENLKPPSQDSPTPISLSRRAPTGPIPTRRWHLYFDYGLGLIDYDNTLEQKNQCVRSQLADRSFRSKVHAPPLLGRAAKDRSTRSTGFPYPRVFRQLLDKEEARRDSPLEDTETDAPSIQQRVLKFWIRILSLQIERTSAVDAEIHQKPVYLVIGTFPRGRSNPRERVVFVDNPAYLFWHIRWASFRLRGLRRTFFSLRHVKSFRLYKVRNNFFLSQRG